jgi:CRISPR/Cas system-associated exonuclease Cas4 (RecB family)
MTVVRRRSASADTASASGLRITSWSDSRLRTYRQCPRKAKYLYIEKLKEPPSAPMEEGNRVHKLAEDVLNGKLKTIPPEFAKLRAEIEELLRDRKYIQVEVQFSFRADWSLCSWFDKDAWLRVKLDVLRIKEGVALIRDWKTGREKDEDAEQLDLYALALFEADPAVNEVHIELCYTKSGALVGTDPEKPYMRAQLPAMKKNGRRRL